MFWRVCEHPQLLEIKFLTLLGVTNFYFYKNFRKHHLNNHHAVRVECHLIFNNSHAEKPVSVFVLAIVIYVLSLLGTQVQQRFEVLKKRKDTGGFTEQGKILN